MSHHWVWGQPSESGAWGKCQPCPGWRIFLGPWVCGRGLWLLVLLPVPITIPSHLDYSRDPLSGLWSPASPLALPSAGRISFLKNVCWKHISGFPRLRTRSGSWMWSTEPHVLQLPGCSASSLPAAHLPLCTRLLYKQYHSRLLPLQAYSPNIQVFLSFSLSLT